MGKRRIPQVRAPTPRTLHGSIIVDTLDLHGLTVDQAERRLEAFLGRVAVREPGGVVRVVTGRGRGSQGSAPIRDMVRGALDGEHSGVVADWSIDPGAGAYLVRLTR